MVTKKNNTYKLSVYCDETVPPFGPTLPNPPEFQVRWAYYAFCMLSTSRLLYLHCASFTLQTLCECSHCSIFAFAHSNWNRTSWLYIVLHFDLFIIKQKYEEWQWEVARKNTYNTFFLPFKDATAFREFLLVKLINGEKATFQTPTFSRKRERTLDMLIKDLYEEYAHDTKTVCIWFGCFFLGSLTTCG